jgi:restriction system protein
MLPILELAADGRAYSFPDAMNVVVDKLRISESDQSLMLPCGRTTVLYNRVGWAITHLVKSVLLERVGTGCFRISSRGADLLGTKPIDVSTHLLSQFQEYRDFRKLCRRRRRKQKVSVGAPSRTRDSNRIETGCETDGVQIQGALLDVLISQIRSISNIAFDSLVQRLLLTMGFGHIHFERQKSSQSAGAFQGVICQDRLRLDPVYVMTRAGDVYVGPGEIMGFIDVLRERGVVRGVFIAAGLFTAEARVVSSGGPITVRLINGNELAQLMIDFKIKDV